MEAKKTNKTRSHRTSAVSSEGSLILFNKPYGVMSQFSGESPNLSDYVQDKGYYPAGRLDKDSEGLLLLTNNGGLQARISQPKFKMKKTYWAQVDGDIDSDAIALLEHGVKLKDGITKPAAAKIITCPLPDRVPGIRVRKSKPTSWLQLTISEGKNRQVRRMTAAVGFPTLRLFRYSVGPWEIDELEIGTSRKLKVNI